MYAGTRFVLGYRKRHPGGGVMKTSIYPCADFVAHLSFREFRAKNPKEKRKISPLSHPYCWLPITG